MAEIYASAVPISTKNTNVENTRRSVTYHPSVWRDHFLKYTDDVTKITTAEKQVLEKEKEDVKKLIAQTPDDSTVKIELIDAIQRLGVAYHFPKEIDESLQKIHDTYQTQSRKDKDDARVLALRFRLLRQQGYRVTSDVFNGLVDEEGNLKEWLISDVEGMLSLYEASNYGTNEEEILEKILQSTSSHLESLLPQMSTSLSKRVKEALEMPISKTLMRLGAKKYIPMYQEIESHNELLLNFAKLDFNIMQKIHQRELNHITRWWVDLEFGKKMAFARDRVVECYLWVLGDYFEPQYATSRIFLTKVIAMISILDDIYDVYGTLDELRRLTDAIRRWDISVADELPPYMRICYEALLGVYAEMEVEMAKRGQSYRLQYAKKEMIKLMAAYMEEAEWCYSKYVPTMKEYMKLALVSGAYMMLATSSLVGMEDPITKHDFDWITNEPPILQAASVICRLMDDMVGHGIEQKITGVDCYMKENDCSKTEAFSEFWKRVNKAWKDLNEECLEPREASMPILTRVVNLARVINILYVDEDAYTNSKTRTKELITLVLVDPVL
uniref:Delta-cadinene synthase n=1 Tax=Salvia pomifera TaxID=396869 RepID=A0A9E7V3T1_SALPM|nr:delta-cadinene synthase [Salvia pomifera]